VYSTFPWVRPAQGDLTSAFQVLYVAGAALLAFLMARTGLRRWLTRWQQLLPPNDF
jgi:hypothetical protein